MTSNPQSLDSFLEKGEEAANAQALPVSQCSLTRVRQQGCGPTRRDRLVQRLPDFKALTRASLCGTAPLTDTLDPNNRLAEAEVDVSRDFVPPFVQEKSTFNVAQGFPGVPGISDAQTSDLEIMAQTPIASGNASLYKDIAKAIRGMPEMDDGDQVKGMEIGATTVASDAASFGQLYGNANPANTSLEASVSFGKKIQMACRDTLYDIVHWNNISAGQNFPHSPAHADFSRC